MSDQKRQETKTDVVLIGAGIMSATLGALLRQLQPDWSITVFERLDAAAAESSDPWNNAGTGHSALCELNYTPQNADGAVDITKAVNVNEQFQVSRQFWAHARGERTVLGDPKEFINPIPHVSFVHGADNVKYLRARYDALAGHPLFAGMEYIDDPDEFARRLPLMAKGRDFTEPVALNWSDGGTDVDFGALTKQLLDYARPSPAAPCTSATRCATSRKRVRRHAGRSRSATVRTGATARSSAPSSCSSAPAAVRCTCCRSPASRRPRASAGSRSAAQFLRCTNPELIDQHRAKVYGKAAVGAPPMSVPHLDTRVIGGKPGPAVRPVRRLVARSSSSRAASPTCPGRSSRTTCSRCSASASPRLGLSST